MVIDEAVKLIKGPKGTKVFLTIKRVEGNIEEISIIRDVVELEETYAKSTLIKDTSGDYGLIELPKFYINFENYNERNAAVDVKKELKQLKEKGLKFYDVDLGPFREKVESVYLKNADNVGGMAAIEALAKQ